MLDIKDYDPEILEIFSRKVLKMIGDCEEGWEKMLPEGVPDIIKEHRLFGFSRRKFANKQ